MTDPSTIYSPEQQQLMGALPGLLAKLPGFGAPTAAPQPYLLNLSGTTPGTGGLAGPAPASGAYMPPTMYAQQPTDPMFGPSYGWNVPASIPAVPTAPAASGSGSPGSGSGPSSKPGAGGTIPSGFGSTGWRPGRAGGGRLGLAGGGNVSAYPPWFIRREAGEMYHDGGLFHSPVAGRTDRIPVSVPAGGYVIPADVVSGLGEGNTLAGSRVLDMMMHTGPFGMRVDHGSRGSNIPRPPAPARFARGGTVRRVPIIVAGGEYFVNPEDVKKWGGGDLNKGHDALDNFVTAVRKKTADKMHKLPGPKKG